MQNRRIVLASRPIGVPQPHHFRLDSVTIPQTEPGEILVENVFLSIDPAQRGYVNDEANYAPPVALGSVMRSLAVGRVIESQDASIACGDYLYGWFGWQEYCLCKAGAILRKVDPSQASLSVSAGLLGINGLTAYLALHSIGKPKAGETIVVTAAAGAVGSIVGQLAKRVGCHTVGVVGSDDKGNECVQKFGYDAFVNYRGALEKDVRSTCPKGINIHFDNVAGAIADVLTRQMAWFGRIVQCGTVSISSWANAPVGPRIEREILTRRLRMEGFVIFDHANRFDEVAAELAQLLSNGEIKVLEDIESGLECAPRALVDVYEGRNRGKKLIQIHR
jgi:NADPH-dependent curcumin reductase CurA